MQTLGVGAACWFPSASARRSCPASSRLVIPLVGREGEPPIAMAWAGAWPVAATGDGDSAGNRPPRLHDPLPWGRGFYWAYATLPIWAWPWLLDEG